MALYGFTLLYRYIFMLYYLVRTIIILSKDVPTYECLIMNGNYLFLLSLALYKINYLPLCSICYCFFLPYLIDFICFILLVVFQCCDYGVCILELLIPFPSYLSAIRLFQLISKVCTSS